MTYAEYCKGLEDVMMTLRRCYAERNRMDEYFDWDINWTMKTMRKGNGILEDIHLEVLEKGLPEDEAFATAAVDLEAFVLKDDIVISENATDLALDKLERLRTELLKGLKAREVPGLADLDV